MTNLLGEFMTNAPPSGEVARDAIPKLFDFCAERDGGGGQTQMFWNLRKPLAPPLSRQSPRDSSPKGAALAISFLPVLPQQSKTANP